MEVSGIEGKAPASTNEATDAPLPAVVDCCDATMPTCVLTFVKIKAHSRVAAKIEARMRAVDFDGGASCAFDVFVCGVCSLIDY